MEKYQKIKDLILSDSHLGKEKLNNGTLLIAKAPLIAPQAWLHNLYLPLTLNEVDKIENEINAKIPNVYKDFLLNFGNGISIFVTGLKLFGLRQNKTNTLEDVWQPFSIIDANTFQRPKNANNKFFIAFYSFDGSQAYMEQDSEEVFRCGRYDATPIESWNNLSEFLEKEFIRLRENYLLKMKQIKNNKINDFLVSVKDISLRYSEINFASIDTISNFQKGYSIDFNNNSLVSEEDGFWQESWIVIGRDMTGDAIIIDLDDDDLGIYVVSLNEEKHWIPIKISNSLDNFIKIVKAISKLSIGRETPDDYDKNSITKKDKNAFIKKLDKIENKETDLWYWEKFISIE